MSCDFAKLGWFYSKLGGNYKLDCAITEYKARGQAFSKGGGNVTVLGFGTFILRGHVH
jgi:hypothetical protein